MSTDPYSTQLTVVPPEEIFLVAKSNIVGRFVRSVYGEVWIGDEVAYWRMVAHCPWPHEPGECPWPVLGVKVMDQFTEGVVPWPRALQKLYDLLDAAEFEMLTPNGSC